MSESVGANEFVEFDEDPGGNEYLKRLALVDNGNSPGENLVLRETYMKVAHFITELDYSEGDHDHEKTALIYSISKGDVELANKLNNQFLSFLYEDPKSIDWDVVFPSTNELPDTSITVDVARKSGLVAGIDYIPAPF